MSQFSDPYGMGQGQRLMSEAAGFAPLASGYPMNPNAGMINIPGLSGTPLGPMLQPMLAGMMGRMGMAPLGMNDQNVIDAMQQQRFTAMQQRLLQQSAELERENWMRTARGMAVMSGTPFGPDQYHAAQSIANLGVMAAPIMASMAPNLLDQLGGIRGSPTVMQAQMLIANRYRMDPVTGQMGMTEQSSQAMAEETYRSLFQQGNLSDMGGFRAGQIGQLYTAMQQRGMIAGAEAPGAAIRRLAREDAQFVRQRAHEKGIDIPDDLGSMSAGQIDQLRLDEGIGGRLRKMDSGRVQQSVKSMIDAVGAVRDIFGDMGQPNAPMQLLISSLERLTQGSMHQISPSSLGQMVRMTHELSQMTGVTIDTALVLQQHAANRAGQLGLDPIFAMQAAQGGMAFGGAYRGMGLSDPSYNAWGRMTSDQVQQLDTHLRVNAAGSSMANRMAVAMRISETMGGMPAGSDAARYVEAIQGGMTEFVDGKGKVRSIGLNQSEFGELFTGSDFASRGINSSTVQRMMRQQFTNQEYIQKHNIGNLVRNVQPQQIRGEIAMKMRETLASRLRDSGVDAQTAERIAGEKAGELTTKIFSMDQATFTNPGDRSKAIGGMIGEALSGTSAANQLRSAGVDMGSFGLGTADVFYGEVDRWVNTDPRMQQYRGFQGLMQVQNEETLQRGRRMTQQASLNGELRSIMAPLGRGTLISRAITAIQEAGPGSDDIGTIVGKALGVDKGKIQAGLFDPMQKVAQQQQAIEEKQRQLENTTDSATRQKLVGELASMRATLKTHVDSTIKAAADQGIFMDGISDNELSSARISTSQAGRLRGEASQLQHGDPATHALQFNKYWESKEGREYWATEARAGARATVIAERMLGDKTTATRYGVKGLEAASRLKETQERLVQLSLYTGGDVARLAAGDLRGLDPETAAKVRAEAQELLGKRDATLAEIQDMHKQGAVKMTDADTKAATDKWETLQKESQTDPGKLAEDFLKAYGVEGQASGALTLLLGRPDGAHIAKRLIEAKKLALGGDRDAQAFLKATGFDEVGKGTEFSDIESLTDKFGKVMGNADRAAQQQADVDRAQPVKVVGTMNIKGKLDLSGEIDAELGAAGVDHEKTEAA